MKGMIFAGCSFTWGQGLWYYSDLPNIPKNEDYIFGRVKMPDAAYKFKDTIRFPRLVANHFKTFEVVKWGNGGCEDESFSFLNELFGLQRKESHITNKSFNYGDIDYIVYQFSELYRNVFKFEYNGNKYVSYFRPNSPKNETKVFGYLSDNSTFRTDDEFSEDLFFNYLQKNNLSFEDIEKIQFQRIYNRFKDQMQFFENKGIKIKILTWQDYWLQFRDDKWFDERLIKLEDNDKTYDCIEDLQKSNPNYIITTDTNKKIKSGHDEHPSKKCVEIIANSIIKSIEKDYL